MKQKDIPGGSLQSLARRDLIATLGGAAALWALAAQGQQGAMPVIGVLGSASAAGYASTVAALQKGLSEAGFVEGKNLAVEYRWADFHYDRLPALAADLVQRRVAVIFTTGSVVSAIAAKSATTTIPIVFANGSDPVQYGLVASINRPGGNVTGVTFNNSLLGPKRVELLHQILPKASLIAVLVNPKNPNATPDGKAFEAAGRSLGVEITIMNANTESELTQAFANAVGRRAGGLIVHVDALFNDHVQQIVDLATQYAMPTMFGASGAVALGGLIGYGPDVPDMNRQAGLYVGRILKGEKPADLPILQPTTFTLLVNLKTAKSLGLTIPETFLLRANQVIE